MSIRPPTFDGKDVAFSRVARLVRAHRPAEVSSARAAESRDEFQARLAKKMNRASPPRAVLLAFAAAMVAVVGLGAWLVGRRASDAQASLLGVWDDQVKAQMRAAFFQSGAEYGADTYGRVTQLLDRYAATLTTLRRRDESSQQLAELKRECLDRRTSELSALTAVFSRTNEQGVVEHAIEATSALTDVGRCADASTLHASLRAPVDPSARSRIVALRARLDQAQGLARTGQLRRALELARPIAADAAATGHAPLEADALALLGVLQRQVSDFAAAEATLREGARAAARAHDDVQEVVILTNLFELVGHLAGRYEEGMALRDAAERAVLRAGDAPDLRARLSSREAEVLQQGGRRDEALAAAERSVHSWETMGGEKLELAHALLSHARILGGLERFEDAQRSAERALAIHLDELGPEHPEVGRTQKYVADFLMLRGRYGEARPYYERALAIAERSTGRASVEVRGAYNGLAAVLHQEGRHDEALARLRDALAISEAMATPDASAAILLNMGQVLRDLSRPDEARKACERALGLLENEHGNPINVPAALDCLGRLRADEGDRAGAVGLFQRALSLYQGSNLDTPSHAETLVHLAQTYVAEGRMGEALPLVRRAVAVYDAGDDDKGSMGDAHFTLALALGRTKAGRLEALELARRARAEYSDAGPTRARDLAKVDRWLAANVK
jgi:tetratricopeptide (TPR) repeat protein